LSLCGWFWFIWACMLAMLVDIFWRSCIYAARNCIYAARNCCIAWIQTLLLSDTRTVTPLIWIRTWVTIWVLGSWDLDARMKRWTSKLAKGRIDKAKTIQGREDWKRITPQLSKLATKPEVIVVITSQHTALKTKIQIKNLTQNQTFKHTSKLGTR
jgi:hypothetical protein